MKTQATRVAPAPVYPPHPVDRKHHLIKLAIGLVLGFCVAGLYATY